MDKTASIHWQGASRRGEIATAQTGSSGPRNCMCPGPGWLAPLLSCLLMTDRSFAWTTDALASLGSGAPSLHWSQLPPLPDSLGFAGPFAGVSGEALLVAGGANFPDKMPWEGGKKVWHDAVYALRGPNRRWEVVGTLPHPLAYGVSVTTPLGVICMGGSDAERHYREVFRLQFNKGELSVQPLPNLPLPLANAAGALVGSTIYLAGGADQPGEQSALNQCLAMDLAMKHPAWSTAPPCPGPARILPVAAADKTDFYLFGGAALQPTNGRMARVYLRDAWRYRPKRGWQRLADLPQPCAAGPTPAPYWDGSFLLLGGDDGLHGGLQPPQLHPGFSKTILAYDASANQWRARGAAPAARVTAPTVFWQHRFVIPSGEMRPGVRSPEVWTFSASGPP